jgi:putative oxidoreductase
MKNLERFTPHALSALRVIAALLFMQHGLQKLLQFPTPSEAGTPGPWTLV